MNVFEMNILNAALLKVESAVDAAALAAMVMKLNKDLHTAEDPILDSLEHNALTILIDLERQREHPRFQNISLFLASENAASEPQQSDEEPLSVGLQRFALLALESRLSPFRILAAA
jgi:hypothetical protein